MNFKVYVVSKKIEKFYLEAVAEYEKRLGRYCKIELVQIKNESALLKKLSDKSYTVKISNIGEKLSSESLAEKIEHYGLNSVSDISLVIGDVQLECDEQFCISPMDMDYGLEVAVLFEQLYRGYRIINGEPYHK